MPADQSLYQVEHPAHAEEWVDFDNSFEFATGYLESNPPSLDSISPKDLELVYSDADALNWDSEATQWPQSAYSDLVTFNDPLIGTTEMPLDMAGVSESVPPPPSFPEMECSVSAFDDTWSSFDASNMAEDFYSPSTYRQLIESQAAADPRCFSKKEKRLEASIALHLQRLQDAAMADLNLSPDSCGSFSSPCWPDSAGSASESQSRGSPSSSSPSEPFAKSSTTPSSGPSPVNGGVELVLDLNMNTTTNLPKKQKPRSQAQKENYIKVRKHGACEKHRKQHKRCNCLDKSASRVLNDSAAAALARAAKVQLDVRNTGQNVVIATKRLSTSTVPTLPPTILDRDRAVKSVPASAQPSTAISPTIKANVQHVERSVHNSAGRVNTVIPPTALTSVQSSKRSAANSAAYANTAVSWTPTSNASVKERIENSGGRAVISVKSPVNVQRSERSTQHSAGQRNTAHTHIRGCQWSKEARPWRTVDRTSLVSGPLVTQNAQTPTAGFRGRRDGAVRAVHFTPGLLRGSSGVLTPFRHRPTSKHDVGKVAESQSTQANKLVKDKENFWFNSQTWSLPGSQAEVVQNSTITEYAGAVVRNTSLAFSAFWQSSTSLTSWAGVLFGRLVLFSSRQHMLARKGMGLA